MRKKAETNKIMPFEDALAKLETVVKELEGGELSLEDALEKFAEGMKLSKVCLARLNTAERDIDKILREEKETLVEYPLELEEADI
ncbi:MAG: Exodeoxyribonuclease 7 small subunit [Firmicutes bacterium]|nr:Exodeoxyribonuclease 7 small subunit [Bacillota bacterium]